MSAPEAIPPNPEQFSVQLQPGFTTEYRQVIHRYLQGQVLSDII